MMDDADLAQLRVDVLIMLPDTATIQRATESVDGYGNVSLAWVTVDTASCRIDPFKQRDSEGIVALREANKAWYQLTLEYDANIAMGDRLVIGGDIYELVSVHDDHSLRITRRGIVAKIQGA